MTEFHHYATPTLATVRSPAYEIGERGATLQLDRLSRGRFADRDTVLDATLQVGASD